MNKYELKKNFKHLLFALRVLLVTIVTLTLYTSFLLVDSKINFLIILILIHLLIYGISYVLERGVFKSRGKIKQFFNILINVSLVGAAFHFVTILLILINLTAFDIIGDVVVLFGLICSGILLQKISFFKLI